MTTRCPVVVSIHVSRGRRPGLTLSVHNAQELGEDELLGMFPTIEVMLRRGLEALKIDAELPGLPDGKQIAEMVQ